MTVIPLPTPPEPRTPSGFPWAATVAPVIASLAIWMLTRSPFALLFALLGPVVAVASLADNRWHGRRRRRKKQRRFDREAEVVRAEIAAAHVAERADLDAEFPSTRALIERGDLDRWHGPDPDRLFLGRGRMPSRLALRGDDARRHPLSRTGTVLAELRALAAHVDDGVVTVDTADGLAFVGVGPAPAAAARSVVLRLAGALDPAVWSVGVHPPAAADDGWRWVGFLPHARSVTEHAGSRAGPATPLTAPLVARRREGVRIDFRRHPTGGGRTTDDAIDRGRGPDGWGAETLPHRRRVPRRRSAGASGRCLRWFVRVVSRPVRGVSQCGPSS